MSARGLLVLAALAAAPLHAQDEVPQPARYRALYPGLYFNGSIARDERDATYDQAGDERASAAPQAGGQTAFPETSAAGQFTWHFPLFESQGVPFFSSRTHTARMTLRYVDTETEGALAAFAADGSDDARTEADDLHNEGHGVGDVTLEFGSFIFGSRGWRRAERHDLSLLVLGAVTLPTGTYDRDAPVSAGGNTWSFEGRVGLHWQPWAGALLDGGAAWRDYTNNEEPAFGGLMPHKQGDEGRLDLSFAQRLAPGLYAGAFGTLRDGEPNEYRNPSFAPNPPAATSGPPDATDVYPTPATYRDGGTALRTAGLSLQWFVTQRFLAALHWQHPLAGRSGQFLLPFSEKSPPGCVPGASNCTVSPGDTVLVDGMGPARAYASDRLTLGVTYHFGQGDVFTCTGCER